MANGADHLLSMTHYLHLSDVINSGIFMRHDIIGENSEHVCCNVDLFGCFSFLVYLKLPVLKSHLKTHLRRKTIIYHIAKHSTLKPINHLIILFLLVVVFRGRARACRGEG